MIRSIMIGILFFSSFLFAGKSLDKVSLQLQFLDQFQFAGYYMAKEKGFYREKGLDVEIKPYFPGIMPIKEVLEKRATYSIGRSSLIVKISQGEKLQPLAAIFQSSPQILLTTDVVNIRTLRDIRGKKVMIAKDSLSGITLQAMLNSQGVYSQDLHYVEDDGTLKPIINGDVNVTAAYISNEPYQLDQIGMPYTIFNPAMYGFDFYDDILFTSEEELKKHPQRTEAFVQASLRGWEYAFSHIDESVDLILAKYNTQHKTKDVLLYEAKVLKKLAYKKGVSLGSMSKEKWHRLYDIYHVLGMIKEDVDFDKMVHMRVHVPFSLNPDEVKYLKNKKEIKICVDPDWMPYESIQDGNHKGVTSDIFSLFSKQMNIPMHLVETRSWDESLSKVKDRECDLVTLAMRTKDREEYLKFTPSYVKEPFVVVTQKDKPFIDKIEELNGKKIVVIRNYAIANLLKKEYKEIEVVEVATLHDAMKMLEKGRVYGYIDALSTIRSVVMSGGLHDTLKISGKLKEHLDLCVGVRNDDPILFHIFSKSVDSLDPRVLENSISSWIHKGHRSKIDYGLVFKLIALFFIIFAVMAWINNSLQKKIQYAVDQNRQKDQQLLEQSRRAQMGELISMIAHQWRQPLGAIAAKGINMKMALAMEKYDLEDKEGRQACTAFFDKSLDDIEVYLQSLTETIDDFRNFYKPNKQREELVINVPFEKALFIVSGAFEAHSIQLDISLESQKKMKIYNNELMQVFLNILKNALDNFKDKGVENPAIMIRSEDTNRGVKVSICDNGGGINSKVLQKIFDPYFSTKNEKNGTGLGLYMSKTIVEEHHSGRLFAENSKDGICFHVELYTDTP